MKPLLLTGARGQLGRTFRQCWPESGLTSRFRLCAVGRDELELTDPGVVEAYLNDLKPALIVNAAALTAVDHAEADCALAYAVNAEAVASLASWCQSNQAVMIQISTDFVFDGMSTVPYDEQAATSPLNIYGASKLQGEAEVLSRLPDSGTIVRTSWLYSEYGSNFVRTMLRLMQGRDELGIVGDQRGSPTSTHTLVRLLLKVIRTGYIGLLHWCDGGNVSWFDFAVRIQQAGIEIGLLDHAIALKSLSTAEYSTAAARPAWSVLDRSRALGLIEQAPEHWGLELSRVIARLAALECA